MASKFENTARELAEAAMDFLHHDANQETYDRHVADLTERFIPIIRKGAKQIARGNGKLPLAPKHKRPGTFTLPDVQRYDIMTVHKCGQQPRGEMTKNSDGEFVLFDDHTKVVERLQNPKANQPTLESENP